MEYMTGLAYVLLSVLVWEFVSDIKTMVSSHRKSVFFPRYIRKSVCFSDRLVGHGA